MRRNGRNRVTDVTVQAKGGSNPRIPLLLTKGGRFLKGEGGECAPSTVAVTSVTSVTKGEVRNPAAPTLGLMVRRGWAKSHPGATGHGRPRLTPPPRHLTTPSGRLAAGPGANQGWRVRGLRWARRPAPPTLPRVGANRPCRGGFGSLTRRSRVGDPALQLGVCGGGFGPALAPPLSDTKEEVGA